MNKQQKELHQISLNSEKDVLKRLTENYQDALDEIKTRIAILQMREDADLQHVIYQVEYQKQLKSQVENILEQLKNNNFESISEYLTQCYEQGFIGTLYEIQGQGVPLVFPIDQEMVVEAIQHETQLSESLYMALGKDTKELSKQIASEISRGITNGSMYSEIARNLSGYAGISKNNAMRIARTEGHRIQNKAIAHAQEKAMDRGADIVKIWDAALDGKTRPHHRELDGQIRELDEPFEIAGMTAQEPGGFGRPEEDINCRCRRISKARWLLDAEETKYIGNTEKMSDEDLEPIANKLNITVEDLRQHSDEIIPVRARNYQDFKRQYDNINNYRNTDAYKEAQERIAGYGKKDKGEERVRSNVQKINDADLVFKDKPNSSISAKQKFKDTMEVSNAHKNLPTKVKASLPDVTFEMGYDSSACDIANKTIRVGIGATEGHINHEYGHLIEHYMMNKEDVDAYKKYLTEGLSSENIKLEIYHDNKGKEVPTYILVGDRFETEYQGRLYVQKISDAINADGSINIDFLYECVSEPFRKYMNNEQISDEARKLIEGALK